MMRTTSNVLPAQSRCVRDDAEEMLELRSRRESREWLPITRKSTSALTPQGSRYGDPRCQLCRYHF